jgi:hypothetical protein
MSGKLHDLASLTPKKEPEIPLGKEAGWAPEGVWTLWRKENVLLLPRIEPQPSSL